MFKFAFIMNIPGESPKTFSCEYENEAGYNLIVGTDGMEVTETLVKKLVSEDFDLINLCGDFTDEMTQQLIKATNDEIDIFHADYTPKELAKLEALPSLKEYGVIMIDDGVHGMEYREIKSPQCNAYMYFAEDMGCAKKAAMDLVENRHVAFIELCSWFDKAKMEELSASVDGKVPIGTCGELK